MASADVLLYSEGIERTGVQRIIDEAGVARGTLYGNFAGKEDLVEAYLARRDHDTIEALEASIASAAAVEPVDVFVAVLEVGHGRSQAETFRGCAFSLAVAEMPEEDSVAKRWASVHKNKVKNLLLAPLVGRVRDPEALAEQLMVLYDGALLSAVLRPEAESFAAAEAAGRAVIAAALLDH